METLPWKATERLEAKEPKLLSAARTLSKAGFKDGRSYDEDVWWIAHEPDEYLGSPDVPSRLIELVEQDIAAIVGSGILA